MRLLYLDESGDYGWCAPHGKSATLWYVLSGFCIHDSSWKELDERVRAITHQYFPSPTTKVELKYSALVAGNNPPYDQLSGVQRKALADDIFDLIVNVKPTLFAVAIDKTKHKLKYGDKAINPKEMALRLIAPRFHKYLERTDELGLFVMDEEERNHDGQLKMTIDNAREYGIMVSTKPWYTDTVLERLVEGVLFTDSKFSAGIQLSDFCAYVVMKHISQGKSARFNQIRPLFDNYGGQVYGLKVWPS